MEDVPFLSSNEDGEETGHAADDSSISSEHVPEPKTRPTDRGSVDGVGCLPTPIRSPHFEPPPPPTPPSLESKINAINSMSTTMNSMACVIQSVQHKMNAGFAKFDVIPTQMEDLTNRIAALETRPNP